MAKVQEVVAAIQEIISELTRDFPSVSNPKLQLHIDKLIRSLAVMLSDLVSRSDQIDQLSDQNLQRCKVILDNLRQARSEGTSSQILKALQDIQVFFRSYESIQGAVPGDFVCEYGHEYSPPPPQKCPIDGTKVKPKN